MEDSASVLPDSSHPSITSKEQDSTTTSDLPSPHHQAEQNDSEDEFHSASEGEDDDEEEEDKKLEEWAESIPELSSDVNTRLSVDPAFTGKSTDNCSSSEKVTGGMSDLSLDSGVNVSSPSSDTSDKKMKGLGEQSPDKDANSTPPIPNVEVEIASSESCQSSCVSDSGIKASIEAVEEVDSIIAAATGGPEEESGAEGGSEEDDHEESPGEKGGGEEEDKEKVEAEKELERKRQEEEDALSEEELQKRLSEAVKVKGRGNDTFKGGQHAEALELYSQALDICPLKYVHQRALLLSNRGACHIRAGDYEAVVKDCTKAIELDPAYIKSYFRRADAYEKLEKLDEALKDHQKVVELDRSQATSFHACVRLEKEINERNEKMKAEMLGKLKDLGNMVLRPFGLSTNNFQLQQDPSTGSYSVQFTQTPPSNGH